MGLNSAPDLCISTIQGRTLCSVLDFLLARGVLCASDGAAFSTGSGINGMNNGGNYGDNIIDETLWNNTFEANHAVFLPHTGGEIYGSAIDHADRSYYWTATHLRYNNEDKYAYVLRLLNSGNTVSWNGSNRHGKEAVRLVRDVQ